MPEKLSGKYEDMKILDTQEYVGTLHRLVEAGQEVSLKISGNSMSPFLVHGRDTIYFKKPDRDLRRGDMVFFQRQNGQYVMHRIWKIKTDGYYIVGDAQTEIEGPIKKEQIFAVVTKVQRKGKWILKKNFCWMFFSKIWIRIVSVRPIIIKVYTKLKILK